MLSHLIATITDFLYPKSSLRGLPVRLRLVSCLQDAILSSWAFWAMRLPIKKRFLRFGKYSPILSREAMRLLTSMSVLSLSRQERLSKVLMRLLLRSMASKQFWMRVSYCGCGEAGDVCYIEAAKIQFLLVLVIYIMLRFIDCFGSKNHIIISHPLPREHLGGSIYSIISKHHKRTVGIDNRACFPELKKVNDISIQEMFFF